MAAAARRPEGLLQFWRRQALVRLVVTNYAVGFGMSAFLMACVLIFNPGNFGRLLESAPLAIVLLWLFTGLTFAGVQTGMAIMNLREGRQREDDRDYEQI